MEAQMTVPDRLKALRAWMGQQGVAAFIVPSADAHQSEYPAQRSEVRAWISGFSGSAGTAVITLDGGALWTDGRYFLQAETQLAGSGLLLMKDRMPGTPEIPAWLSEVLPPASEVGIDPGVYSAQARDALRADLEGRGLALRELGDPFAVVWPDRPALPAEPIDELPAAITGETRAQRLARLRAAIRDAGASTHLIGTLDDIAWVLNLRGADVAYNPLFLSWLWVEQERCVLFTAPDRIPRDVRAALGADGVETAPYNDVHAFIGRTSVTEPWPAGTIPPPGEGAVLADPEGLPAAVLDSLAARGPVLSHPAPTRAMKQRKNPIELSGMREAMIRDGRAMVRTLRWLDEQIAAGTTLTEAKVGLRLTAERRAEDGFRGESFPPICGFNANGAIIHYRAPDRGSAEVSGDGVLLLDSGAHYSCGTTDITRTVAVGRPPQQAREDFTRVLLGHIALTEACFPAGTSGLQLDTLARAALWRQRLDYGHGTGHGVGFILPVHEGPVRIATRGADTVLEPGMLLSNEPGVYRPGLWGIRIENLLAVREAGEAALPGMPGYLEWETLTLCPIDRRMLEPALLSRDAASWLDAYHRRCRELLSPGLDDQDREWLERFTAPVL